MGTLTAKLLPASTIETTTTTTTGWTTTSTTTADPNHPACCWYWSDDDNRWHGCDQCEAETAKHAKRMAEEFWSGAHKF